MAVGVKEIKPLIGMSPNLGPSKPVYAEKLFWSGVVGGFAVLKAVMMERRPTLAGVVSLGLIGAASGYLVGLVMEGLWAKEAQGRPERAPVDETPSLDVSGPGLGRGIRKPGVRGFL